MIAYIHGFNSSPNSQTSKELKKFFPDLLTLNYDSSKSYTINLFNLCTQNIKSIDTLIGLSLGAFYACELGNMFGIPTVLINPVINPTETLSKFIDENTLTKETVESYSIAYPLNKTTQPKLVFLGSKNALINPVETAEYFEPHAKVVTKNFNHKIPV